MASPYLKSGENIVLATHNILIQSVSSDVILTDQRLIISDSSHSQFQPEILPLATVMTITKSETAGGDPCISLSIAAAHGATKPLELIFSQKPRQNRMQECDDWIKKMSELSAAAREEADKNGISVADLVAIITAEKPVSKDTTESGTASPANEEPFQKIPESLPKPPKKTPASRNILIVSVAAVILILIAAVGGWYVYTQVLGGQPGLPFIPAATPTPTVTTISTTLPTPVPVLTTEPTPKPVITTPVPTTATVIVPQNGIWVKVDSPVRYSGSVGTSGSLKAINTTGTQYYQIPASQNAIIDISIQKQEPTGEALTIDLYNNGLLVRHSTTTSPFGTIELHIDLKSVTPVVTK